MTTTRVTRVAVATVVQLLLVGVAVWAPLAARFTGEEVSLRVQVVEGYLPFEDSYVDVSYPDLPQQPGEVEDEGFWDDPDRGAAYVPLTQEGAVWVGGDIQRTAPDAGIFLACDDSGWRLRCGIETAYLATGSENEAVRRALDSGDAVATVRVDSSGHAALIGVSAGS